MWADGAARGGQVDTGRKAEGWSEHLEEFCARGMATSGVGVELALQISHKNVERRGRAGEGLQGKERPEGARAWWKEDSWALVRRTEGTWCRESRRGRGSGQGVWGNTWWHPRGWRAPGRSVWERGVGAMLVQGGCDGAE